MFLVKCTVQCGKPSFVCKMCTATCTSSLYICILSTAGNLNCLSWPYYLTLRKEIWWSNPDAWIWSRQRVWLIFREIVFQFNISLSLPSQHTSLWPSGYKSLTWQISCMSWCGLMKSLELSKNAKMKVLWKENKRMDCLHHRRWLMLKPPGSEAHHDTLVW